MNWLYTRTFKVISFIVLFFFTWTSGGLFQAAYAINSAAEQKSGSADVKNQTKKEKPEEKLQKELEEIEGILTDTGADTGTKKNKLKTKKTEIESLDVEIKKQFKETEGKIKDLPDEILQRHKDFVKHYDDNLKELNADLDAIDKAKTEAEITAEIEKTKAFLEKVKPTKKHTPLDPNNLPHRTAEPVFVEPRTSPEQFLEELSADAQKSNIAKSLPTLGKGGFDKPILVASNGPLDRLLNQNSEVRSQKPEFTDSGYLPTGQAGPIETFWYDKGSGSSSVFDFNSTNSQLSTPNLLLAAATPPSPSDLSQTIEVQFTPEITAKAEELQHNPVKIYNWVRNNIEFVPTYGSIQGANMCLQTKLCNAIDTSSLLIALLRASNIPAKYVRGTVEIPIEKVKNWAGGFTDTMTALNLLASAGIPTAGQVVGGEIKYVRIEHIWVEAYVDYLPSRGAKHKTGDTWIPLDASFKQYTYTQGIDIKSAVPFDAQAFVNQIQSTATINETEGYVTNVNSSLINQTMTDYQTQVQNYITQTYPNATVGDVLGKKEVIKQEFPHLLGTLPYKTIVKGAVYSSIPSNLRHSISFNVTKDIYDELIGTPLNISKSLPELAGKKITLSYSPATSADEAVINKYLPKPHADGTPIDPSELPTSLPAYLINVKPELRVDGQVVATGTTVTVGFEESLKLTFTSPNLSSGIVTHVIKGGEHFGIAIVLNRISQEQLFKLKEKIESTRAKIEAQDFTNLTKDDILGDPLYTTALSYYAESDMMDNIQATTIGVASIRLPSEAVVASALKTRYFFGTPHSVSAGGLFIDAARDLSIIKPFDGDNRKAVQMMWTMGMIGSALEHSILEHVVSFAQNPVEAISAVKALRIANAQGIPIYTINQSNVNTILPQLSVDTDVKTDIRNAVNARKTVTIAKTNITLDGWTGCGYIIIDPKTGSGAYMISGGLSGGAIVVGVGDCDKPYLEKVVNNFNLTNDMIFGVLAPTGLGMLVGVPRQVAALMGTITFFDWLKLRLAGAIMEGVAFSALETGTLVGATSLLSFLLTSLAYEIGVMIGSFISVVVVPCEEKQQ